MLAAILTSFALLFSVCNGFTLRQSSCLHAGQHSMRLLMNSLEKTCNNSFCTCFILKCLKFILLLLFTDIMIKPDGVQRGVVGDIIGRFEAKGYLLKGLKLVTPDQDTLQEHYKDLREKSFFPKLITYMSSGPVVAMVCKNALLILCEFHAIEFVGLGGEKCCEDR